ncbi:MAG: hypothetical protein LBQ46_12170 [Treponema sp.]|jgi:hypothetical protein|nr:hypothetical protein [Treponema sp.]
MRNLLNFIFSNLVPILVVTSVAIRIIVGMRNSARKKPQADDLGEQEDREEEYTDVWTRLKPDDEEDRQAYGSGEDRARPLLSPAGGMSLPPVRRAPEPETIIRPANFRLSEPAFGEPALGEPSFGGSAFSEPAGGEPPFGEASAGEALSGASPAVGGPSAGELPHQPPHGEAPASRAAAFFRRTGRLSPLRQAVIFSEILGKPKAFE